jgi:hypothetical protein
VAIVGTEALFDLRTGRRGLPEDVEEAVALAEAPLRPGRPLARAEEQVPIRQGLAAALHREHIGVQGGGNHGGRKLPSGHTGRLEHPSLLLAQPIELMIDELAQALRQPPDHIRRRRSPGLSQRRFADHAPAHQIVHHRDHEQGVAVGVPVNEPPPVFSLRRL